MFTGIIKGLGTVVEITPTAGDQRLAIDIGDAELGPVALGDSISVSGTCLTVTEVSERRFAADVSTETLSLTTLGALAPGSRVNLEAALRAGEPLGGHLVSGHVDGFGMLEEKTGDARSWRLLFSMPQRLARFIAPKGSICVDGISLTVNEVDNTCFGVNIIPHTMSHTTLGERIVGEHVNLEIDVIARYVARLSNVG